MQALEHIRVLDLSIMGPGHFSSQYLADMGADVIRVVAPPGSGKANNPFAGVAEDKKKLAYDVVQRNKRCIAINLKEPGGKEAFIKLAKTSDVIIESARPGAAKRLGIDFDSISKINPRIVYCSISGYGQDGPYALRSGHDLNYISYAGILSIIGELEGAPVIPDNYIADFAGAGLHGLIGVLSALLAREKTGKGQFVDISFTDAALSLNASTLSMYLEKGFKFARGGMPTCGPYPAYACYQTKDNKWISIGCFEPWFWQNACKVLGLEQYVESGMMPFDAFDHPKPKAGNIYPEVFKAVADKFKTKNRDEWVALLAAADVPVSPVLDMDEVANDPQIKHRMIIDVDVPDVGKIKHPGFSIRMSDTPCTFRRRAPMLGEHTDELMKEVGYTQAQIDELKKVNAVG